MSDGDMPDQPLADLAGQYAELVAVLDRGEVLRKAIAAMAGPGEAAWAASPTAFGPLSLDHVVGDRTGLLRGLEVPPGTGLTGKVHRGGGPDWVDDYFRSSKITHTFDEHIRAEGLRRVLAVPLMHNGSAIGVLALGRRVDGAFGGRDVERVSALAAQAALAVSVAERARLAREIAVHEERERLAAALHDSVGALLFAIGSGMQDLAEVAHDDHELRERLDRLRRQAADASSALRESLRTLRASPSALALGVALRGDCAAFSDRTGIPAELVVLDQAPPALPPSRSEALVAAVREALLNVEKHARAGAVVVTVGRFGSSLTVAVHDDGVGLGHHHRPGLGLTSTAEALARLGGSLTVESDADGGTAWRARLPC
ncbi:GAF domain-containing protein [Streptomyces sp. B21-108]|uniref:GAF domain-containing sensor histidine kinase n=1 Tax=Streptomyces sp. B21-108 TaxID=3039419 RepID=UPI002FEE826A